MRKVTVLKENGETAGKLGLPDSFFGADPSEAAVYYAVNATLANRRQGDANTRTRSEVRYSTAKPWRQKGTGRARAGTRRSPIWRGGGTIFGPRAKDYEVHVPRKLRRRALVSALSAKAEDVSSLIVIEDMAYEEPRTRRAADMLENVGAGQGEGKVLILVDEYKPVSWKSVRNLPGVSMKKFSECNAYDVLLADKLVIEKSVIEKLEQTGNEGSVSDNQAAAADREE